MSRATHWNCRDCSGLWKFTGELERWQTPHGHHTVTNGKQRQGFLQNGFTRRLFDFAVPQAEKDGWQPKSYLICIGRKALDCFNWRDLNTARNHSPLNWFLVLGPFSASWSCDDNRGGSLQERTHCSANMSTIHLPDPPVFFSKKPEHINQYDSVGEIRKLQTFQNSLGIGSELPPI